MIEIIPPAIVDIISPGKQIGKLIGQHQEGNSSKISAKKIWWLDRALALDFLQLSIWFQVSSISIQDAIRPQYVCNSDRFIFSRSFLAFFLDQRIRNGGTSQYVCTTKYTQLDRAEFPFVSCLCAHVFASAVWLRISLICRPFESGQHWHSYAHQNHTPTK